MKLLKRSALFLAMMTVGSAALALPSVIEKNVFTAPAIHAMRVKNTGGQTVSAQIFLHAGVTSAGSCVYTYTTPVGSVYFSPYSSTSIGLIGDNLARSLGLGYSCMDLVLQTDRQTTHDTFWLYHNSWTYTYTNPAYDDVTVS